VLVPSYHGGMFDHNTRRVLISFCIVFLTFDLCFRQVTSDSSKGATVTIICAIVLLLLSKEYYSCLLVTGDNPEEAIVKVTEGNRLDET
jgi:hypothetical protein